MIIRRVHGEVEQVILANKSVENVRCQYHTRRHCNSYPGKTPGDTVVVQKVAHESEAASLSTKRAATNAKKIIIRRLESGWVEIANQHLTLFATVFGDGFNQVVPQIVQRREIRHFAWAESLS